MKKLNLILDAGGVLILWDRNKTERADIYASEYVNEELLHYLLLHKEEYIYSLLTNNDHGAEERILKKSGLPKFYQYFINSSGVGISKPDSRIYLYTLDLLKADSKGCIFVDDSKENVDAALAIGMNGIVYREFSQFKNELEQIVSKISK